MKRIISFLLIFVILLSSSMSFAATGDFIHTGLKRAYDVKKAVDRADLIRDLKNTNIEYMKGFYREIDGGKYVNIVDEEAKQEAVLKAFFNSNGINADDSSAIETFLQNTDNFNDIQNKLNVATVELGKNFSDIEDIFDLDYYYGGSSIYAQRLMSPDHYTLPENGSNVGTTIIKTLKFPIGSGATKWLYKISEDQFAPIKPNEVVTGGTVYTAGTNITIAEGKYLLLCATDFGNKVKAYASIKITSDMVKMPLVPSVLLDIGTVSKGTTDANAIRISDVPEGNWKYFIRSEKLDVINTADKFPNAVVFDDTKDIVVADDKVVIDELFKRYVYLIKFDENNKIVNYIEKEIKKSSISTLPEKLVVITNYKGPVQGEDEDTTMFSELNIAGSGGTEWQHKSGIDINVPIADSIFGGTPCTTDTNIPANVGDKLLLAAVDTDGKIKAYAIFTLTEANVKGKTPPTFANPSMMPIKGNATNTTMVKGLTPPDGATKFMYAIGNPTMPLPALDRIYLGAKDYNLGDDILAENGQRLYIFATDADGKVKMSGTASLANGVTGNIKDPLAMELKPTTHYSNIVKGNNVGKVNLKVNSSDALNNLFTTPVNVKWRYKVSKDNFDIPELDSFVADTSELNGGIVKVATETELKAEDPFARNLLLLAIEGDESDFKIKGYAMIPLNREHINYPDANELVNDNYSKPEKGPSPGTTKITTLDSNSLDGHKDWYYRVFKPTTPESKPLPIEYKEVLKPAEFSRYTVGSPITASSGDYIVLVSVDGSRKALAYKIIDLDDNNITAPNATPLRATSHYEGPVPGSEANSTKFTKFYSDPSDTVHWMYKKGSKSFGPIESGSFAREAEGYIEYTVGNPIDIVNPGDYILLVRTDGDYKVTGYVNIPLTQANIRNSNAQSLSVDNYKIDKGIKPSTTKLYDLNFGGIDATNFTGWKWMYKILDTPISGENLPYLNQKIVGAINYTSGNDIVVSTGKHILLLATDSSGQTKAYIQIPVDSTMVRESATEIDANLSTDTTKIDSVKIDKFGAAYRYLISNTEPNPPATGDSLPTDVVAYTTAEDIVINIGKYLTIYEVGSDEKIVGYKTFKVESVKQGKAVLSGDHLLEGNIKNGGLSFTVKLSNGATWTDDLRNNKAIRDKLFNGLKTSSESAEWSKVIASLVADGKGAISVSGDKLILTILLPQTLGYDIKEDQNISLTVPYEAINGALNHITATGTITIRPTVGATISGDVVSSIVRQSDIIAGGKTIVVELADGIWADDVSSIINGFKVVGVTELEQKDTQWYKIANAGNIKIVRNSGNKVTITLPAVSGVNFKISSETISLTIPKSLIPDSAEDFVVASPNFTLYPDILEVKGNAVLDNDDKNIPVILMAPDYRIVDTKNDLWKIKVIVGNLRSTIDNSHVQIVGLPKGLVATATNIGDNTIGIKISGTASATLTGDTNVRIKIRGHAVTEPNSIDSAEIEFVVQKGFSMIEELKKVTINVKEGKLLQTSKDMKYNLNSSNGVLGEWLDASTGTETTVLNGFIAGKVYVKDKDNDKVFYQVANLAHGKAPVGIVVSQVNYEGTDIKIKLDGFIDDTEYDISLDGGVTWKKDFIVTDEITLTSTSDLRVRFRATVNALESLATAKIPVLDLSKVKFNVSKGLITNTTADMQYSLNNGESYLPARSPDTTVTFVNGAHILIRDKNRPSNNRDLGTVGIMDKPVLDGVSFDITAGSIAAPSGSSFQYRVGVDGSWKDLVLVEGKSKDIEFKPGKVQIRTKADGKNVASESVDVPSEIPAYASAPEIRIDDYNKDIYYFDGSGWIDLENTTNLQYKINDGGWIDSLGWKNDKTIDLITKGSPNVSIRVKATVNTLPSLIKTVNFKGNLILSNVKLNVVNGLIEGVTTAMQYSMDSTDGLNGTWTDVKANGNIAVTFIQGKKIYIRENSKPLNVFKLSDGIGLSPAISLDNIKIDIINGSISNYYTRPIEYKMGSDPWTTIDRAKSSSEPFVVYVKEFKAGKLEFRAKGTETLLPSPIIYETISAKASAPQLKHDNVSYRIEKIGTAEGTGYEYSINGGIWIDGIVNTVFEGTDVVLIRIIAATNKLPSEEQKISFTKNLDLSNVLLNAGESQIVNTSDSMEYSVDSENGEDGLWSPASLGKTNIIMDTNTIVHIREKAKPRNYRRVNESEAGKKIFDDGSNIVSNNTDYNILQKTISIKSVDTSNVDNLQKIVNDLQYKIGNGNWTNVDYVTLEAGKAKVIAYNVNFVPGNLEFRLRGDANTLPSESFKKYVIPSHATAPNVSVGFDLASYKNKIEGADITMEYSFGSNGPWMDMNLLDNENLVGDVYVRTKAKKDTLPSQNIKLIFKPVLNLKAVNLSTHVSPFELNGTTTNMKYRINGVEWKPCINGNTKLIRMDGKTGLDDLSIVSIIEVMDINQPLNTFKIFPAP